MYTEEEFMALEEEERELTDEAILIMLLILANLKGDLEKELRNFYQKYGKDGVVTYAEARKWISEQDHRRRLTAFSIFVAGAFTSVLADLEDHFRKFLTEVIGKEAKFFGVKIDVDKLLLRKWGLDDLYWLQRLEDDVDLWMKYVLRDVKRGIYQRKNIAEILKDLDKRFDNIYNALKNLGITESTAVGSLSRQEIFKELGVTKYQFYTRPDERRCETCGSLHGLVFPISAYVVGETASPIHPRCRCWEVPIMD